MTIPRTLFDLAGVEARIHHLEGREPFILASDIATIYGTRVNAITQAVRRNPDRFPEDFAFRLSDAELEHLKTQNVFSTDVKRPSNVVFTHGGANALSGVLKTPVAAQMSVTVHRAFAAMEKQALADARLMVQKLNNDTLAKKPIYAHIDRAARNGWSLDQVFANTSYPKWKLEQAVTEMVAMRMLDAPLAGMQPDMFGSHHG